MKRTGNKTWALEPYKHLTVQVPACLAMVVPMCSQTLYGHTGVVSCSSLMSLTLFTCFEDSLCTLPGFSTPHDIQETVLMDDERKVTAMRLPFTPGPGPSRAGLPSSQCRGAQAEKWAEFQSFVPRHCLTAKCTLTKLSICSRDQMMCGFSCIRAKEEKDLYLNRDVKASSETGAVTKAARLERHFNL